MPDLRVLVSPEGDRIAQSIPDSVRSRPADTLWVCLTWPDGTLSVSLLSDEDVAGWREVPLDE